jgi:hypothetical protein
VTATGWLPGPFTRCEVVRTRRPGPPPTTPTRTGTTMTVTGRRYSQPSCRIERGKSRCPRPG